MSVIVAPGSTRTLAEMWLRFLERRPELGPRGRRRTRPWDRLEDAPYHQDRHGDLPQEADPCQVL